MGYTKATLAKEIKKGFINQTKKKEKKKKPFVFSEYKQSDTQLQF